MPHCAYPGISVLQKVLTANDHDDVLIMCAPKAAATRGESDLVGAALGCKVGAGKGKERGRG